MRTFMSLGAIALVFAMGGETLAATVNAKSGQVFIDRGQGYVPVANSTQGKPGETVMVMAGGSGEIIYDDGCRQAVDVGSVVVIGETSPCLANPAETDYTLVIGGVAVAAGVGLAIGLSGGDSSASK
jgi:hypothetical protein